MKGILAEPGKAPVIASLPDSLWAIENRLGTPCEMIVMPSTPAVLFVGRYDGPIQPASLLNRKYRGRQLYGPILCYGWKGNNIQPMNKDVQTEMLDRLKDTEVRVHKKRGKQILKERLKGLMAFCRAKFLQPHYTPKSTSLRLFRNIAMARLK